jgi:hypothetical protein
MSDSTLRFVFTSDANKDLQDAKKTSVGHKLLHRWSLSQTHTNEDNPKFGKMQFFILLKEPHGRRKLHMQTSSAVLVKIYA